MERIIALLLAFMLLLSGCSTIERSYKTEPEPDAAETEKIEPTETSEQPGCAGTDTMPWYNAEVTDFGLRLLRGSMDAEKNALISPVSVYAALSMIANGAEGNTLSQMETVLGQSVAALNSWHKLGVGEDDPSLHTANGIWFKDDPKLTVEESFLQTNQNYYGAGVYKAPFDHTTLQDINAFVEENTDGMVKDILDEIPEEAVMYLVNALAFDAQWREPYKSGQVHAGLFTTEDGTRQEVELMWAEESCYLEHELATGFCKYYKDRTDRYAFAALLPKEGTTVAELIQGLDGASLRHVLANPQSVPVNTAIPKFEVEYDTQMSEILKSMGMTDAFDEELADFSALGTYTNGNIYINRVIHKTFISVAEKGTKAGAATVVEEAAEGAAMMEVKNVVLDRPFLYMIVDTETNTPIFLGTLMEIQ